MMCRDFTLKQYTRLCLAIRGAGYSTPTLSEYLSGRERFDAIPFILLRHDIDNRVDLPIARKMAAFEASVGIRSTWYFRATRDVFKEEIIREVHDLGHEVGYHYEVLNESGGDVPMALALLAKHLEKFRRTVPVTTICQHGGSLGEDTASTFAGLVSTGWKMMTGKLKVKVFKSIEIWKSASLHDFGLIGEAYLSPDFNQICYISDTGLRWDAYRSRVLDEVPEGNPCSGPPQVRNTRELIRIILEQRHPRMNILVHPANWIDPLLPWLRWHALQIFRNTGKRLLLKQ